jgi:hypothetical protein
MPRWTAQVRATKPEACNNDVNTVSMLIALILTIKTDGGFTGRGTGNLAINGEKMTTERCEGTLSRAECKTLEAAIAAAKKVTWRDSYGPAAPDAIQWTMETDDRKASWYDNNDDVPKEIRALRDAAWTVRTRVINDCR